MATAVDVAEFILRERGAMTAMKVQKLTYYAQAWHAVWSDTVLFQNAVKAWANGPVIPALYDRHRGRFMLQAGDLGGNPDALTADERESVLSVLDAYGDKSSQWLSDLTHREPPWRDARAGLVAGERGDREITVAAMAEYYGSL